jgi:hypothetical protein
MTLVVIPEECQSMPMTAPRLEPERVREASQQLVPSIMMDDRLADHRPEAGHPVGQPSRNLPTMQRQIGAPGPMRHLPHLRQHAPQEDAPV